MALASNTKWWKSAAIYQIYPASFKDSNGDGIGDLPGILSKLDYVKSLGVGAVWISPFYASPNHDQGYDISDYQRPAPEYGSFEDIEALIKGCHDRGMKVMFDLVISHTSDQHKWFQESRKSKDNPYRKFYIWRPARYTETGERLPPANWMALFGGSAWEYDKTTDEYYLHSFLRSQPDLNWEDAGVREAIYEETITFWLERGVDGMRIDVANLYSKGTVEDVEITRPEQYLQPAVSKYVDGPRLVEFTKEMIEKSFAKFDAVSLAECPSKLDLPDLLKYVSAEEKMYSLAITFDAMRVDHYGRGFHKYSKPWKLSEFKQAIAFNQQLADPAHDGWACNYLENHDQARSVSRFMSDAPEHRQISAKTLAILLLTQSGTPIIYQQQELGQTNFSKDWPVSEYVDSASQMQMKNVEMAIRAGNTEVTMQGSIAGLQRCGRDHGRTPMQWSGEKGAGFSTADKTWMRINDNYTDINVASQEEDPNSVLNFYRTMMALRKEHSASLIFGTFKIHDAANEETFVFTKHSQDEDIAVVLNMSAKPQKVDIPHIGGERTLLLTSAVAEVEEGILKAYEGRIYRVKGGMRIEGEKHAADTVQTTAGPAFA